MKKESLKQLKSRINHKKEGPRCSNCEHLEIFTSRQGNETLRCCSQNIKFATNKNGWCTCHVWFVGG